MESNDNEMTPTEKSAIIGYFRNGMKIEEIAAIMGISVKYVEIIIKEKIELK